MDSLDAELERARALDVSTLADAIEELGFECTRCGACCKGHGEEHTATVFPDEVRDLTTDERDWRDVARPMPFGLSDGPDGPVGETFEWALQVDDCGDCTFYRDGDGDESGSCTVYGDRPLICQTYPFSVGLGTTEPWGDVVAAEGPVRAHECEGLGREIPRADAESLARTLKERAVRELEEAIAVVEAYEPTGTDGVVVHDSEGAKRPDGTPIDRR